MLQVSEVTSDDALPGLEATWRELSAGSASLTPFQTWEWVSTWWRFFKGPTMRLRILCARDSERGGATVGLMPLLCSWYRGVPLRRLAFLGAPQADYQDLLARPADADACAAAFFAHLAERAGEWDFADLNDLRDGGPLLVAAPQQGGLRASIEPHRTCPYIALPASYAEYHSSLSKNMRALVGRRRRQLAKSFRAEFDTVGADDLDAALTDLFTLHNQRWRRRGAMGAFGSERLQQFHRTVARRFLDAGYLRLHRLRLDGAASALFYCFQVADRVYYYLSGFSLEHARFSVGTVLMSWAIEQAIAAGARSFDMLRGDEGYKYNWRASDGHTRRLLLGHGGLRSRFGLGGHRLERAIEHAGLRVQHRLWGQKKRSSAPAEGEPNDQTGSD